MNKTKIFKLLLLTSSSIMLTACSPFKTVVDSLFPDPLVEVKSVEIFDNDDQIKTVARVNVVGETVRGFRAKNWDSAKVNVEYFDKNNKLITKEKYDNFSTFFKNNKNGMTLVKNDGKGTKITYLVENNDEPKEFIVEKETEVNQYEEVEYYYDLKDLVNKNNREEGDFVWLGETNNVVNNFEIYYRYDEPHTIYTGDVNGVAQYTTIYDTRYVYYYYDVDINGNVKIK